MTAETAFPEISRHIWRTRYRAESMGEDSIEATWQRVAAALAGTEPNHQTQWAQRFYRTLENFRFLPGGRILAGAGSPHNVTLFNCFVMGTLHDSLPSIFNGLREGALTMQHGGGVGYDFSPLRPHGFPARHSGAVASGPVSFMHIWDSMCATLLSTGARRGAMMGVMRCDHPDIETFIDAKRDAHALRHFNLSVLVSDALMQAVHDDAPWPLRFPSGARGKIVRTLSARALWERLMRAAYACAEPGVIFIDRVNQANNLAYCEQIHATNPCGEIPLPPYGACDLGSINLTQFVQAPFTPHAEWDWNGIAETTAVAVRMLDNVYELARFPLRKQAQVARASRRIGLGITGLADAFAMLGIVYGSPASLQQAEQLMSAIGRQAYRTSIDLAREKGAFPLFDAHAYLQSAFIRTLPPELQDDLRRYGIRNSHLTAIAPTGSISLLAGNISSGLEPIFDWRYQRQIRSPDGRHHAVELDDYAYRLFRSLHGAEAPLPPAFVRAAEIDPLAQLDLQSALQRHVDNAISKTVNVPADYPFDAFRALYEAAYARGLKGCTVFRPNPVTGAVLSAPPTAEGCCPIPPGRTA